MSRSQKLLAGFFTFAGIMHFVRPREYAAIVSPWVPRHREVVAVSGIGEIPGGLAITSPATRPLMLWVWRATDPRKR